MSGWSGFLRRGFLVAALGLLSALPASADVRLHPLFSDGMVLQRGMKVPIWGTANDGEKVTVEFQGQTLSTTAKDGKWQVVLQPLQAGGPFQLDISGSRVFSVLDCMVGEVWLCGGQSNMQWSVLKCDNPTEILAKSNNPQIRLVAVLRNGAEEPQQEVEVRWMPSAPSSISMFSAVGYFFGRDLHAALNVPIGLISANCNNTAAESWMSREALSSHPELKDVLEKNPLKVSPTGRVDLRSPVGLYNGMIHPLIPYAIRGVIWYQGESNVRRGHQYHTMFPALINSWRKAWGQGDFPFLFVQIAPYGPTLPGPAQSFWAELREAQLQTLKTVPNTAMVVTTDLGHPHDLNPKNKEPVAARLALAARGLVYGEPIVYSGPIFSKLQVRDDRIELNFDHLGDGLVAKDGPLKGFTIAGEDRKFFPAEAQIEGDKIVVNSPQVPKPVAVRYGWADFPVLNLWNKAGLPASPFRTDKWPMLSGPEG